MSDESFDDALSNLFGGKLPSAPNEDIAQGAVAIFGIFTEYVKAGFTVDQAMQLILTMVAASMKG